MMAVSYTHLVSDEFSEVIVNDYIKVKCCKRVWVIMINKAGELSRINFNGG